LVEALARRRLPAMVAGQALLSIGAAALPDLERMVANEDDAVRAAAIELIGFIGNATQADLLIERLRDPSAEVRAKAARALGRLGAAEAATGLRNSLRDRIPFVRVAAARALGAIGDQASVPALIELADGEHFDVARASAMAVARIAPTALDEAARRSASPHLLEALDFALVHS
jgi:HEAT repeat protein